MSGQFDAQAASRLVKVAMVPIGGWVCPKASLDAVEKRKISWPFRIQTPAIQTIAHHYSN
jgi:hypothetical protein